MSATNPETETLKTRLKGMWMAGDFGQIPKVIEKGTEDFIALLNLKPGSRVLDVATTKQRMAPPISKVNISR